ncbi:MAG: polyribonucleotide nucleotidyltransferase [Deltaproteobacteria bacterium]|nr:polyribonucleotide nucleotidyltransferase [Deltaproteobacteria bacterium]
MSVFKLEEDFHGSTISIETGRVARQAHGSILLTCGDTIVLATAAVSPSPREGVDFLPLTCDYLEKTWAAGKIPGGFFKREGRPTEREVLVSRMVDRPLRPLFPEGFHHELQVVVSVISKDEVHPADVLAITAASAAVNLSKIPFGGPLAGVRVGRVNGQFICNPTHEQIDAGDLEMIVVGTEDAVVMVEGGSNFLPEKEIVDAIIFGHKAMQPLIALQKSLRDAAGVPKMEHTPPALDAGLVAAVESIALPALRDALNTKVKAERYDKLAQVKKDLQAKIAEGKTPETAPNPKTVSAVWEDLKYREMRRQILEEKRRVDGRDYKEIRDINCEVGFLPRPHGSALFTRGETQALVAVTLGTRSDEQKIEGLYLEEWRRFMLHYNFPPFSVGEVRPLRSPGRREIGHGALARRGLENILPTNEDFPYTIRIVSDILESNGSSSMATVCGSSLALMHAGVPVTKPVAGIAMGLVKEGESYAVLSDILGDEDHLGDMDFKVVGSAEGVSAVQMDIKISGIDEDILRQAMEQARTGRLHILGIMNQTMSQPAADLSKYAPRITTVQIPIERIKDLIGPGGKTIRAIIEKTGVKIDVEDDGRVLVSSPNQDAAREAIGLVRAYTSEAEVGKYYMGRVVRITDFGAFVEIMPGQDGLVHISHMAEERIRSVRDVVKEGDEILVKVLEIDRQGRIRLSRKEAMDVKPEDVLE